MSVKLNIKRCQKCGATVKVIQDCTCGDCGIKCCGEQMETLISNSVDAAIEKHVPTYEVVGNKVIIKVNHVMEEDHYIEWISVVSDTKEITTKLKPGEKAEIETEYIPGATIYAYCNKHGLWKTEIK